MPEGFQTSEFLMEKGFIDLIIDRRKHRDTIYSLLSKLAARQNKGMLS